MDFDPFYQEQEVKFGRFILATAAAYKLVELGPEGYFVVPQDLVERYQSLAANYTNQFTWLESDWQKYFEDQEQADKASHAQILARQMFQLDRLWKLHKALLDWTLPSQEFDIFKYDLEQRLNQEIEANIRNFQFQDNSAPLEARINYALKRLTERRDYAKAEYVRSLDRVIRVNQWAKPLFDSFGIEVPEALMGVEPVLQDS